MAEVQKGELQDNLGNTIYPHTESDVVFCSDGQTVQEKLTKTENVLGDANGKSGSLEVDDPNILATTEATHELSERLTAENAQPFKFGYDAASGKYGYWVKEADTDVFVPFKTTEVISLGSGTSFDVSSYDGYENFTADNFIVQMNNLNGWNSSYDSDISGSGTYFFSKVSVSLAKSYNASTGILSAYYSISNNYGTHMASPPSTTSNGTISVTAYLVLK